MAVIVLRGIGPVDPAAMRCALARAWRKNSHGGAQIPDYVVEAMHADYRRSGSLSRTGASFGRTKQDLAYIFRRRGLPVKTRGGVNRVTATS